ncbi:universal stress protein [Teichococcus rhizosphaerae]|nr:universal stress protein [Pseudoroseomonas rhizosphaerae]
MAIPSQAPATMLLATDLSARCDRAQDRAVQLARQWSARLVAVHALESIDTVLPRAPDGTAPEWRRPRDPDAEARALLEAELAGSGAEVVVGHGDPATLVLETARQRAAGLIVTGLARAEPLGRLLTGATVEEVVRQASVPVLAVRQRARAPYAQVLVATDFSPCSRHALLAAAALFPDLPLTLFHAHEVPFPALLGRAASREEAMAAAAGECRAFLAHDAIPQALRDRVEVVVEPGNLGWLLQDYVPHAGIDLLVLGTHGRSRLMEMLLGSTAGWLLQSAPCDVMLVREPATGKGAN